MLCSSCFPIYQLHFTPFLPGLHPVCPAVPIRSSLLPESLCDAAHPLPAVRVPVHPSAPLCRYARLFSTNLCVTPLVRSQLYAFLFTLDFVGFLFVLALLLYHGQAAVRGATNYEKVRRQFQ